MVVRLIQVELRQTFALLSDLRQTSAREILASSDSIGLVIVGSFRFLPERGIDWHGTSAKVESISDGCRLQRCLCRGTQSEGCVGGMGK